jgi:drug/metabolite transporter (DMT)-like permease
VSLQEFLLFLTSILLSSGGQGLLKLGAIKLGQVTTDNFVSLVLRIALTPELVGGLLMYGISAVFFILVLTRVKLSVAGPAISVTYVFSVLMGYFLFNESITMRHLIGLAIIICGVILVVKK